MEVKKPKSRVASTLKFKIGRYIERIVFGCIKKALFLCARIFFSGRIDTSKHSIIMPEYTYSPWMKDEPFQEAWSQIRHNTRVDEYRCYSLWQLIKEIKKLKGDILEVGVWRGGSGCLIGRKCQVEQIPATIYLCDTFRGVVKAGEKDPVYKGGEVADTSKEIVEELSSQMALDNVRVLEGIFPDDTGSGLENKIFRFCHIDVDVYQSAKDILDWVWGRLVIGGLVVFDDYGHCQCDGITELVEEAGEKPDRIVIHNLNGHAIMIKLA
ncbi:MAG: TylF/MycF/NovP-related O-methyltransferase [Nitrospinaceae bacterium]